MVSMSLKLRWWFFRSQPTNGTCGGGFFVAFGCLASCGKEIGVLGLSSPSRGFSQSLLGVFVTLGDFLWLVSFYGFSILPFAQEYVLCSLVGFEGNPSLLDKYCLHFSQGAKKHMGFHVCFGPAAGAPIAGSDWWLGDFPWPSGLMGAFHQTTASHQESREEPLTEPLTKPPQAIKREAELTRLEKVPFQDVKHKVELLERMQAVPLRSKKAASAAMSGLKVGPHFRGGVPFGFPKKKKTEKQRCQLHKTRLQTT